MKSAKPTGCKLSTVVSFSLLSLLALYCFYLIPLVLTPSPHKTDTSPEATYKISEVGYQTGEALTPQLQVLPGPRPTKQHTGASKTATPQAPSTVNHIKDSGVQTQQQPTVVHLPSVAAPVPEASHKSTATAYPAPQQLYSKHASASATLVVGGTDGSGTRRVVQILAELGVLMVSEDPETYDIHADNVKGWPTVVAPVVLSTKTLDYDPHALPRDLQMRTETGVRRILDQALLDSSKPTSYKLAVGGALQRPAQMTASGVTYGFKAPVAMTLAPCFADLSPHFKLVHVLRDGRDLSFSANQGPVSKFYASMYGAMHRGESAQLKSIRLWSDWNSQIHHWALQYVLHVDRLSEKVDTSFGYFAIHSEDLVSSSLPVRHSAISHLAEFVGSNITPQSLCCLALRESDFMGSHDRTSIKKNAIPLSKRYGKWHTHLDHNKALSDSMHTTGREGLRIFGYDPVRVLPDDPYSTYFSEKYGQCSSSTYSACGAEDSQRAAVEADSYKIAGKCAITPGIDYLGGERHSYASMLICSYSLVFTYSHIHIFTYSHIR
jgi:hypothetical protein